MCYRVNRCESTICGCSTRGITYSEESLQEIKVAVLGNEILCGSFNLVGKAVLPSEARYKERLQKRQGTKSQLHSRFEW